jgi:hypothetical protein
MRPPRPSRQQPIARGCQANAFAVDHVMNRRCPGAGGPQSPNSSDRSLAAGKIDRLFAGSIDSAGRRLVPAPGRFPRFCGGLQVRLPRFAAAVFLALSLSAVAADSATAPNAPANEFLRFIKTAPGEGRVDTAVKSYRRDSDGEFVSLVAVVHVGDAAYYDSLQKLFEGYDAVLYEMIRDRSVNPAGKVNTDHPISQLQIGMKTLLGLEFQLDRIDYSRTNFVHADLDPAGFFNLQAERGESIFGLLFKAALEEQRRQSTNPDAGLNPFSVLFALTSEDSAHQLKFLLGQQMGQMEDMMAGIDQTADGKGSAILSGRNEHAMKILAEQIAKGKKRLAIFYGAGHMPDFEQRLLKEGFKKVTEEWRTAWDIRGNPPDATTQKN